MREPKKPQRGVELLLAHVQSVGAPPLRARPDERLSQKLGDEFAGLLVHALSGAHGMRRRVA